MSEPGSSQAHDAEFKLASAMVQDGVTRVTVVVPRAPGVLVRARVLAQQAGVEVSAGQIGSEMITIRFAGLPTAPRSVELRPRSVEPLSRRVAAVYTWLRTRAFGLP
jgi:hypothetical protein